MPRIILIAPARRRVGLTTVCLGLLRAFDRQGTRVAYARPIAGHGADHAIALVQLAARLRPPQPIASERVDELLAKGDDQRLMEEVVALCAAAAEGHDVLLVEGMVPESGMVYSMRVNQMMLKALDAELVLVGSPGEQSPAEVAKAVAIAARGFGALPEGQVPSCVLNRVCNDEGCSAAHDPWGPPGFKDGCDGTLHADRVLALKAALAAEGIRPLAIVPCSPELSSPRVKDVAQELGASILHEGNAARRRVRGIALCAMTARNLVKAFRPGLLAITPGDREDVIIAASLAVLGGTPLAGLLLTGGIAPDPVVLELCKPALQAGLPILSVKHDSYGAATRASGMNQDIPADDTERTEATANFVADRIEPLWLGGQQQKSRSPRVSPPAFRHRLVERARALSKRILLPEGTEPRTLAAAAIAQERGIARCALMGEPAAILEAAAKQGITLPSSIEIIDAPALAPRYASALVDRRKHKGMTPQLALSELAEPIMLGTLMMDMGEADGLVSGAVHSTAHTIRPALQIIKTAKGQSLVSSVFFMCLPDQVLVFGDCAVNPNPTAEQLAEIASQSADSARAFGIEPRVAMLSYSTGTSGAGEEVDKVKRATELARKLRPDLPIDGPLQYDAAVMPDVARTKMPGSPVAGQATVFVFPDLNTGNVTYKAVQRSANVVSMGPMLQGLARPVNDLSRGCLVEDIVFTIALTAVQAGQAAERSKG
jgi:phosphate acetyltransferase